VIGVMS